LSHEDALKELLKKKQFGEKIEAPRQREPAKVISLMDALRRSVDAGWGGKSERRAAAGRTPKKAARSSARKRAGYTRLRRH
jgi:DNA end-binding protein Ku